MSRLSIDLTPVQHQRIKAVAAFQGKTLKEYTLERLLPYTDDERAALHELEAILQPRIESAYRGEGVEITAMQIAEEILAEPHP
jgi:hypothetical protein